MTMAEVEIFITAANQCFSDNKYTLWAVEEKATQTFMGFVGLWSPEWEADFTPCIEIGWRLGSQYWGKGYATDAAKAVLNYGFNNIGLDEVVSFTSSKNIRSIRVMEKIGMTRDYNADFLYPKLPADHTLAPHVLYRIHDIPLLPTAQNIEI